MAQTIQAKRRRRLTILIVVALLVVAGIVAALFFREWQQAQRLHDNRDKGLAAYKQGDYATAAKRLQKVAGSGNASATTLYKYALARLRTPMEDNAQIGHAMLALKDALNQAPDNLKVGHRLIELLGAYNQHADTIRAANTVLKHHANDLAAARAKARALLAQAKLDQARAVIQKAIDAHPKDIQSRLLFVQIARQADVAPDTLLSQVQAWHKNFAKDARFNLPLAFAYELAGDRTKALAALADAAKAKAVEQDPVYAASVLKYLDAFNAYDASLALLKRAADPAKASAGTDAIANEADNAADMTATALYGELVQRLFEAQQFKQAIARIDKLDPSNQSAAMLGIKALALRQMNRSKQAKAVQAKLASLDDHGAGQAWATILKALGAKGRKPESSKKIAQVIKDHIDAANSHAYLHYFEGQALANLDHNDAAAKQWRQAMKRRPSWAAPRVRLSRLALSRGNNQQALQLAQQGLARQPGNTNAAVTYVMAAAEGANTDDKDRLKRLLKQARAVQRAAPGEPYTKLLTVTLNAQLGHVDKAKRIGGNLLNRNPVLAQPLLVRLANMSREYDLGLQERAYALVSKHYGVSPNLALVQALDKSQNGQTDQGLSQLESGIASAKQPKAKRQWRLAKAKFLERTDPKQARKYWMRLAEQMADNAQVQRTVLNQGWVVDQRPFMKRTLDRLHKVAGENDPTWRVYQAQYLITQKPTQSQLDAASQANQPNGTNKGSGANQTTNANSKSDQAKQADRADASKQLRENAAQAKKLLQPVVDAGSSPLRAHLLMATAQQRLGNNQQALQQLGQAESVSPGHTRIALRRAQLELNLGRRREAAKSLQRATQDKKKLGPSQQAAAASMYGRLGDNQRAISMLENLRDQDRLIGGGLRQLAELYLRTDQPGKALAMRQALMNQPSAADVMLVSLMLRRQGQAKEADQVLGRLKQLDLATADRQTLLGSHYAQFNESDQAIKHLRAATDAAPHDPRLWRRLVRYLLAQNKPEQALAAANSALQQVDDHSSIQGLRSLVDRAALVRGSAKQPVYRPLLISLLGDASTRPAIEQALDRISQARQNNASMAQMAQSIGTLARSHQNVALLQRLAAKLYQLAGRDNEAADLAKQSMQKFGNSVESAALAAQTLLAAHRFDEALVAVNDWRSRAGRSSAKADYIAARAQLGLNDSSRALGTLKPHMAKALKKPKAGRRWIVTYIEALCANDQVAKARKILEPMVDQSPAWQNLWVATAASRIKSPKIATDWLKALDSKIKEGQLPQQIVQTHGFWTLAKRTGNDEALAQARQHAKQLVKNPKADDRAWMLRGLIAETSKNVPAAIDAYNHALKANSNNVQVKNNLAMVLADQNTQLDRAVKLAQQVVQARPKTPTYLDTLAHVQARAGQYKAAINTIDQAIELDPRNDQWPQTRQTIQQMAAKAGKSNDDS